MQTTEGNFDRVLLIVMALLAIASGVWFGMSSRSFPSTLERAKAVERAYTGVIPVDRIEEATRLAVSDPTTWTAPVRTGKPVPLFKSVLLLIKYDQPDALIDMFTEDVKIRDPITNKWLRESNLPRISANGADLPAYLVPNVGDLDSDGDGFTNREEFDKQTNPTDAGSHPPFTDHLFLVQRIAHNYTVTLKSSGSPMQILVVPENQPKKSWFVYEGARFGAGDRFIAGKLDKKIVPDPKVGEKDVSELPVEDTVRKVPLLKDGKPVIENGQPALANQKYTLVNGVEINLAEYEAHFQFKSKVLDEFKVMKGDNFKIPSIGDTTYKVIDIQEESAVISPLKPDGTPEKEIIIKKS